MDRKTLILTAVVLIAIVGIGVGAYVLTDTNPDTDSDNITPVEPDTTPTEREFVIDAMKRKVPIPDTLKDGIVTLGSAGPLRYLSVFDVYDYIIEIDKNDWKSAIKNGKGYAYAYDYTTKPHHESANLSDELVEHVASLNPSLVVMQQSIYEENPTLADVLAKKVPILVTPRQNMIDFVNYDDFTICDTYVDSITMVGQIVKKEDRAAEHLKDVQEILNDIRKYVKMGADPGKTYVAGLTIHGSNAWSTTFPNYIPLRIVSGVNAYNGPADKEGRATLTVEDAMNCIMKYNKNTNTYSKICDRVVIDPASSDKVSEPTSQSILEGLYKINNDGDPSNDIPMYVTYSIVLSYINYDCVLAGSYYLCELLYGTITHEQVLQKAQNVFDKFYGPHGANVPEDMADFFVNKSAKAGIELPILEEVKVVYKDGQYRTEGL